MDKDIGNMVAEGIREGVNKDKDSNLKYIAVTAQDGELIAFYDEVTEAIVKNVYHLHAGYGEPIFKEVGNKIFLDVEE